MRILFVCSGNTCRSPLAAAIAGHLAAARGIELVAESAGTSAVDGAGASDGSLLVALERGLDLTTHRARRLDRALVAASDLILAMGPAHVERAAELGGQGKAYLLTAYGSRGASTRGIIDPFGAELAVYRTTADELEHEIGLVLDRIAAERASDRP